MKRKEKLKVEIDPAVLAQILGGMASNGTQATSPGGVVIAQPPFSAFFHS